MNFSDFINFSAPHGDGGAFKLPRSNVIVRAEMHCIICNKIKPWTDFLFGRYLDLWLAGLLVEFTTKSMCFSCRMMPRSKRQKAFVKVKYRFRQRKLKSLCKSQYSDYINSDQWVETKKRIGVKQHGSCECCGGTYLPIHAHHIRYTFLGSEKPSDIAFICAACHAAIHKNRRKKHEYPIKPFRNRLMRAFRTLSVDSSNLRSSNPRLYALAVVKFFAVGDHVFLKGAF